MTSVQVAPARVRLRPGLHVVRRDSARVQVGLDPPHRVILPADPACLSLVETLRHAGCTEPLDEAQARIVRALRRADLLIDDHVPARRSGAVALHDHGLAGGTAPLGDLLSGAGVAVGTGDSPDLVVACASAPLPRAVIDPWLAEGTPHLVVCGTGRPGSVRVGPLVEPGLTACLRCIDAAEATDDPRRPLIVEQLATRPAAPIDPLSLAIALAWAARDVVGFLAGQVPATWSATVDVHEGVPTVQAWSRHPHCGCCWDELPY